MIQKGFVHVFLLIVIVLVGIIGIGYFAYKNGQIQLKVDLPLDRKNNSSNIPLNSPTLSVNEIDISNWKTYKSTELGITFKYPEYFRITENYDGKGLFGNGIHIDSDQTGGTPERWMRITRSDKYNFWDKLTDLINNIKIGESYLYPETKINFERQENTRINQTSSYVFADNSPSYMPVPRLLIFLPKGQLFYIFDISYSNPETNKSQEPQIDFVKTFDQILSTFKFIDHHNFFQEICEQKNGKWLTEYNECETSDLESGIKNPQCENLGGKYNECNSACRHNTDNRPCITVCIQVCKFD